jgi:hypothetical protein
MYLMDRSRPYLKNLLILILFRVEVMSQLVEYWLRRIAFSCILTLLVVMALFLTKHVTS